MSEARPLIALRWAAHCASCGVELPPRTEAHWDKKARTATCRACLAAAEPVAAKEAVKEALERGTPGASAAREWTRRHDRREQQARDRYGRLSGIYLSFTDDPHSTRAWATGTDGERALGSFLAGLDDDSSVIVLHDRRIPGSRANIDHIAITRSGIHAIDAKNYKGKVQRIDKGGWFSLNYRLVVGRRDCTALVGAMTRQVEAIRKAVGRPLLEEFALQVYPALCFVNAEWSLFARPFEIGGVWVGWSRALGEWIRAGGPLEPEQVRLLAERVAAALPPA